MDEIKETLYTDISFEKWKPLIYKGEKTHYEISTFGRAKNSITGRILRQFIQNNGYYGFTISINNELHSVKTAKMVALHFIPNDDPKHKTHVNHIKGILINGIILLII
jgi:hypothetical protein